MWYKTCGENSGPRVENTPQKWMRGCCFFCNVSVVLGVPKRGGKNQNTMLSGIINLRLKLNTVKLPDYNEHLL